jgi:hypothetical protein
MLLGQALQVEDFPLEDPPNVRAAEVVVVVGLETGRDMLDRVLDYILEGLIAGSSLRLLPDQQGHDEQEHPYQ